MKIIVTGSGKSGSWRVRGEQLGIAIGATVLPRCTSFDGADVVVAVKRPGSDVLAAIKRSGLKWVWDVVDAWPQKGAAGGNCWGVDAAISWLRGELWSLKPDGVVFTTTAMKADSGWTGPALVLPHHAWPRYATPNELRPGVSVLGYEGGAHYLGAWAPLLQAECRRRGWRLEVNGDMQQCDVGIALREQEGHPARRWKSNVKLANIQALGIPALCSPEAGYLEFARGGEIFLDGRNLSRALDACASDEVRARARHVQPITLSEVAKEYREWLTALSS